MKKTSLAILCGALTLAIAPTSFSQTIISGGEGSLDYIGDFTGVTIPGDDLLEETEIDDGWFSGNESSSPVWSVVSGVAERNSTIAFQGNAVALAFDSDADGQYTLSLEYDVTRNTNQPVGWALLGYTPTEATNGFDVNLRRTDLDAASFGNLAVIASDILPVTDAGTEYIEDQTVNEVVNLDSATYQGYVFLFSSAGPSDETPTLDNVTLTVVPEPSAAALLLGALGIGFLIRRRRR